MSKSRTGHFFEDFRLGQKLVHATPRTLTMTDQSLYIGLTGSRTCLHSAETVARAAGFERRPLEDLLIFNTAFGKTVPDIPLNAVANLIAAQEASWGPIQFKGKLQDRATYRYFWNVLEQAHATGMALPDLMRQRFFA